MYIYIKKKVVTIKIFTDCKKKLKKIKKINLRQKKLIKSFM